MKKLPILVLILLLLSLLAKEPPKGTNTIIIKWIDFKTALHTMADSGYTID